MLHTKFMKRYDNLFDKIVSIDNLKEAYRKAKKGKSWQDKVRKVECDLDNKMFELQEMLVNGTYKTSSYKTKEIHEPKKRTIYILPFYPDRIVHHAIMNVLENILDKRFYVDSYACRKGKGQHKGSFRTMDFVRKNKYVLQCDVSKFYMNVDHKKLKLILCRMFKDRKLVNLLFEIIDSIDGGKNVPIGNYLSQWFGNLYLNELDNYVKHTLRVKSYIRYCDDFCIYSNDKSYLSWVAENVKNYIDNVLYLRLSKIKKYPTSQGVDFLGYRHFPKYILLRKSTKKRVVKRIKGLVGAIKHGDCTPEQAVSKIASAKGWLKHAQTHNLQISMNIEQVYDEVIKLGKRPQV